MNIFHRLFSKKTKQINLKDNEGILERLTRKAEKVKNRESFLDLVDSFYEVLEKRLFEIEKKTVKVKGELEVDDELLWSFLRRYDLDLDNETLYSMENLKIKSKIFFNREEVEDISYYLNEVSNYLTTLESNFRIHDIWSKNIDFWKEDIGGKRKEFEEFKRKILKNEKQ